MKLNNIKLSIIILAITLTLSSVLSLNIKNINHIKDDSPKNNKNNILNNKSNVNNSNEKTIGEGKFGVAKLITENGITKVVKESNIKTVDKKLFDHKSVLYERKILEFMKSNKICQEFIVDYLGSNNVNKEFTNVAEKEEVPKIFLKFEKGNDLEKQLKKYDSVDKQYVNKFMFKFSSALKCLHEHDIYHKDALPRNIFLREASTDNKNIDDFVIGDFGLAIVFKTGFPSTKHDIIECLRMDITNFISTYIKLLFPKQEFVLKSANELPGFLKNALIVQNPDKNNPIYEKFINAVLFLFGKYSENVQKKEENYKKYQDLIVNFDTQMVALFK